MSRQKLDYGTFYKAVGPDGLSVWGYPDEVDWIDAIGHSLEVYENTSDLKSWHTYLQQSGGRPPHTGMCTRYLLHGYATIEPALIFGREQFGWKNFRVVEFRGQPVATLGPGYPNFAVSRKFGFRVVDEVIREVPLDRFARRASRESGR